QAGRKQRMQLAQENYLPAFAFHGGTKRLQFRISCELSPKPAPRNETAQCKRNRRGHNVTRKYNEKSPPQTKEKTASHSKDAARQQQDITSCKKQRVANPCPSAPTHYTLLQGCDESDNRKEAGKRHSKCNPTHDRGSLPENYPRDTEHF